MTVNHLKKRRHDWKNIVDYETHFQPWFSVAGFLHCFRFPRTTLTISVTWNSRGLTAARILRRRATLFTRNYRHAVYRLPTGP
jgi:hypothetical protein